MYTCVQPTEYYDAFEEWISQVSMDDLAAEGLLLIRMQPDQQGRYGFIVKVTGQYIVHRRFSWGKFRFAKI